MPNREDQDKVKRMLQIIEGPQFGHVVGPNEVKLEKQGGAYHNRETVLRGERINVRPPLTTLCPAGAEAHRTDRLHCPRRTLTRSGR